VDALSADPLAWLEGEVAAAGEAASSAGAVAAEDADLFEAGTLEGDLGAEYASVGGGVSRPLLSRDVNMTFPNRPLSAANPLAINSLGFKDTDFDGDEIELEDYWTVRGWIAVQQCVRVAALRMSPCFCCLCV
jgi:hypothetical protein